MTNKIRFLREERNLTQNELAEKTGLSLRTIQRIEAGNVPKGFTLTALAKALEIEPEIIFHDLHLGQSDGISHAKIINITSLSFLLLPFGNIILPAILTYKAKDRKTKDLGKGILGIQIIWTIITSILMIASPFIQMLFLTKFPLFIAFLIVLICLNVFIILRNGISLNQKRELCIGLKINFL